MKTALVILASAAVLAAVASHLVAAPASTAARHEAQLLRLPPATVAGQETLYGRIRSLTRKGRRYEMRFDPAWFLTGVTAERAAVEDGAIEPGQPVPNDNYVVEAGHRLLTYVVPANAHVTVLTRGPRPSAIPVSELAEIVKGKNPQNRPLFVPGNRLGFWIRVGFKYPSLVNSLDQQYRP